MPGARLPAAGDHVAREWRGAGAVGSLRPDGRRRAGRARDPPGDSRRRRHLHVPRALRRRRGVDQHRPHRLRYAAAPPLCRGVARSKYVGWTDVASAERELITAVWKGTDRTDPLTSPACKHSSDLYQFQERPLAKVGWTCPPQSSASLFQVRPRKFAQE